MDQRWLTLLAVVEEGGFMRAARVRNLSQPAVSYQMRQLAEEYGVEIFRRDGNTMELTPEGSLLVRYARDALRLHQQLLADLQAGNALQFPLEEEHHMTLPPIQLTRVALEEAEALAALWRSVLKTPGTRWTENYPTMDEAKADIARDGIRVLRDEQGRLIASVAMEPDEAEELSCCAESPRPGIELSRICVAPAWQGKGLAGRVLAAFFPELAAMGYRTVHLLVSPENPPALKAYTRLGFHKIGECQLWEQHWWVLEKVIA